MKPPRGQESPAPLNRIDKDSEETMHAFCNKNETSFLIDTGSSRSFLPSSIFTPTGESKAKLVAANGTPIEVQGTKNLFVDLNLGVIFYHKFVVANVREPILGMDFLKRHELLVDASKGLLILPGTLTFAEAKNDDPNSLNVPDLKIDQKIPLLPITQEVIYGNDISSYPDDLKAIFRRYPESMNKAVFKQEPKHSYRMKIHLTTEQPIYTKPRRLPISMEGPAIALVDELQDLGIVAPCTSSYNSPAFLVKKPDWTPKNPSYRIVSDYRQLNEFMRPCMAPLPHTDTFTVKFHGMKYFSKIDLSQAFYSLPLDEDSWDYTAFSVSTRGQYYYKRASMGLKTSANQFQAFIRFVFHGCETFLEIYIDDICVFTVSYEEHLRCLEIVFQRMTEYGLVVKLSKCSFFQESLTFLGYQLSSSGVKPLTERVLAIRDFQLPVRQKALRRFAGMVAYNKKFLVRAAELMAPIYDLMENRGNKVIEWTPEALTAFDEVKTALADATLLAHPIEGATLMLYTDSSSTVAAATLKQEFNGQATPLGFFSRRFNPAQMKYSTFTQELLSAKMAIHHFAFYLKGREFILYTDCQAIVQIIKKKSLDNLSALNYRLLIFILENTDDVRHIPGDRNTTADALTRSEVNAISDVLQVVTPEEIALEQTDDFLNRVRGLQKCSLQIVEKKLNDSGLTLFVDVSQENVIRPLVPDSLRFRVFQSVHSLSHPGYLKSRQLIADRYCWPGMNSDIRRFVSACNACGLVKVGRNNIAQFEQFPVVNKRFHWIHLDLVGALYPSVHLGVEYKYLLTIICRASRWLEVIPLVEITAEAVISAFLLQWVARFGCPKVILTDRGSQFTSRAFKDVTQYLGATHKFTTAYRPMPNGVLEVYHRVIKNAIKCYLDRPSWMEQLPFILLGMRSAVGVASGISPVEQVFGQNLRLPCQFFEDDLEDFDEQNSTEQIRAFGEYMRSRRGIYPRFRPNKPFIDPKLWVTRFVYIKKGKKENLLPNFKGPFLVLEKHKKYFKLLLSANKTDNVSIDRLKACSSFPFNVSPVDIDFIFQGPFLPVEEQVEELPVAEEIEVSEEDEEEDILDQHPGLLEEFFRGVEQSQIDPSDTGIRTRSGRTVRLPRALRDYEL